VADRNAKNDSVPFNQLATLAKVSGEHHERLSLPFHVYQPVFVKGSNGHLNDATKRNRQGEVPASMVQNGQCGVLQTVPFSCHRI
jgi:hypothetical protein